MLDYNAALALLASLEAEHGADVLAELVGAAFRKDKTDYHAKYAESDGLGTLEAFLALDSTAEDSYEWCAEFCNHPDFGRIAGLYWARRPTSGTCTPSEAVV